MAEKTETSVKKKITFKDQGQDFLWFIIDGRKIVDCGPYQSWVWCGMLAFNPDLKVGERLEVTNKEGSSATINYPVIEIEILDEATIEKL